MANEGHNPDLLAPQIKGDQEVLESVHLKRPYPKPYGQFKKSIPKS